MVCGKVRVGLNMRNIFFKKILYKKQSIHFLHIGKTGGTAVKYALKDSLITKDYVIHRHKHKIQFMDIPKGEKIIFFLRDPITRFVSGFYSRKREGKPKYFYPWSREEKVAFEYFYTPNELALSLSEKNLTIRHKAEKAMRSIGHVKESYWNWFKNEQYFKERVSDIFFIGFQESLSEDFEILKKKLNLPIEARLPDNDINAHKAPKSDDTFLEEEAISNLKKMV